MLGLILYILLMVVFLGWAIRCAFWPVGDSAPKNTESEVRAGGAGGPAPRPTTLEGALTAQLIRGEIGRRQYQVALERLALRDAVEHPLSVPEKGDSSADM